MWDHSLLAAEAGRGLEDDAPRPSHGGDDERGVRMTVATVRSLAAGRYPVQPIRTSKEMP